MKQTGGRGTFAEYVAISTDNVVPCPGHLSGADQLAAAAAFPLGGLTAYRCAGAAAARLGSNYERLHSATFTKGRVRKGQNVLITGIGGGVALQALQYAVAVGANVYVTSGDQGKIDKAVELGAKAGFNYKDGAISPCGDSGRVNVDVVCQRPGRSSWRRSCRRSGRCSTSSSTRPWARSSPKRRGS